jgi:hypothetical protein
MAENKTKPSEASVERYLNAITDVGRREDCRTLVKIMSKATKQEPKMWGTAIVGFGVLKYKYASGREGEICRIGFSSRKGDISIYGTGSAPDRDELLSKLGKHKTGKGCLYVSKLGAVDLNVLGRLIAGSLKAQAKA